MKQHLELNITGKVQGIGFRYEVKDIADKLSIQGYARNLPDGSVVIEAEAASQVLDQFLELIKGSPGYSKVENVAIDKGKLKHYREFTIY